MRAKLKKLRKERNLTQQEVVNMVGVHRTTYTNIENDKADPSFKVIQKIKKAFLWDYKKSDRGIKGGGNTIAKKVRQIIKPPRP